jgi:CCR4-NOT transcription complex subunit 1
MNSSTGGPSSAATGSGCTTAPNNDAGASSAAALIRILPCLGPACTSNVGTLRDALRLPDAGGEGGVGVGSGWKEGGVARLLHFFSVVGSTAKRAVSNNDSGSARDAIEQQQQLQQRNDLSSAFVGAYLNNPDFYKQDSTSGRMQGRGLTEWNLEVVSRVFSADLAHLNWHLVARSLDFPEFNIRSVQHLEMLQRLFRSGAQGQQLPLDVITFETWSNRIGQLTLLRHLLLLPPNVYNFPLDAEEALDASTAIVEQGSDLVANNNIVSNMRGWASSRVLQRLLHLSDDKSLHPEVREIFVVGLTTSPEIILCALVRLQLSITRSADQASGEDARAIIAANAVAGMPMKGELMRELIPMFFKPAQDGVAVPPPKQPNLVRNLRGALRRLWSISQNTVVAASIEAWRSTSNDLAQVRFQTVVHIIGVVRILPAPETAIAAFLNVNQDHEFSFAVAFVMADHDMLHLRSWLSDRWNAHTGPNKGIFANSFISYIGKYYTHATPRQSEPLVSIENLATALQFLSSLDLETFPGVVPTSTGNAKTLAETVKGMVNDCVARHPSLGVIIPIDSSPNLFCPIASQAVIEDLANQYFQQIFSSEDSARKVVETLKSFRTSGTPRDNEVFQCMIHNLFDEHRFLSKYPEKELRITGILFGLLIKEQLVSSETLGIALRFILEALRKPPSQSPQSNKMFRFGMFALEEFKERLHEWRKYCSHIVQIPHLREEYAQLVLEIESAMSSDSVSVASSTSASGLASGTGWGA